MLAWDLDSRVQNIWVTIFDQHRQIFVTLCLFLRNFVPSAERAVRNLGKGAGIWLNQMSSSKLLVIWWKRCFVFVLTKYVAELPLSLSPLAFNQKDNTKFMEQRYVWRNNVYNRTDQPLKSGNHEFATRDLKSAKWEYGVITHGRPLSSPSQVLTTQQVTTKWLHLILHTWGCFTPEYSVQFITQRAPWCTFHSSQLFYALCWCIYIDQNSRCACGRQHTSCGEYLQRL